MSTVYVGSSLFNTERVKNIQKRFEVAGVAIAYNWAQHGRIIGATAETYNKIGNLETNGVKGCDLFFMVHPARFGTHTELGIAIGTDKPIVMLNDTGEEVEEKPFYHLANVFRFTNEDEALTFALSKLGIK